MISMINDLTVIIIQLQHGCIFLPSIISITACAVNCGTEKLLFQPTEVQHAS